MFRKKTDFEEYLNEMGCPTHENSDYGGRVSSKMISKYGTWLRRHDPTAFEVGFNEWKLEYLREGEE